LGTLPGARRDNSSRVNAGVAFGRISSYLATGGRLGESTTVMGRVSLSSSLDGLNELNGRIENSSHMGGRDSLLNHTPFKISIARSGPDKGGCDLVTFSDCLHITRCGVGGPGHVFFPLNAHQTWMNVEPFACNRPVRSTAF
jgi:hypothetical protein